MNSHTNNSLTLDSQWGNYNVTPRAIEGNVEGVA